LEAELAAQAAAAKEAADKRLAAALEEQEKKYGASLAQMAKMKEDLEDELEKNRTAHDQKMKKLAAEAAAARDAADKQAEAERAALHAE